MTFKVFIDFESTGLSTLNDEIVQIGAVGVKDDGKCEISKFKTNVFTERKINIHASRVTGITNETIQNAPNKKKSFEMLFKWINDNRAGEDVVFIAYNGIRFDFKMFYHEMKRIKLDPQGEWNKISLKFFLDPFVWAKNHMNKSKLVRKKNGMCSYCLIDIHKALLGKCFENAHDALCDTFALYDICMHENFSEMTSDSENIHCIPVDKFVKNMNTIKIKKRKAPMKCQTIMETFSKKKKAKKDIKTKQN